MLPILIREAEKWEPVMKRERGHDVMQNWVDKKVIAIGIEEGVKASPMKCPTEVGRSTADSAKGTAPNRIKMLVC